ncbi:MAG: protoheme IX farnesyltransferase [Bacteroidetes bacterium]|jgi:protoheme IX farnesyltransferase|nr:protoheme IX farnesyltransferase [Bacteroidota bacterium]
MSTNPSSSPAETSTATAVADAPRATVVRKARDLWELVKPEISFLVTVSALAGFLLGSPDMIDPGVLIATLLGVFASAGGSGVFNHVTERHLDARMKRTMQRPLPANRISLGGAVLFGGTLLVVGLATLYLLVNTLTAGLAALTAGLYVLLYTPLKQRSKLNTLVGTIPGALPALGGWTAATGALGWGGWALFGVLLCWQMPHFLSLAWMYRKDYARAGYAMLPVVEPDGASTAGQTLFFTILLLGVSLTLLPLGVAGWVYATGALLLGLWFCRKAYAFYLDLTPQTARQVLMASIVYIPALVALIFVDWLI